MKKNSFYVLILLLSITALLSCDKPVDSNTSTVPGSNWWMLKGHFYRKSFHPGSSFQPPLVEKWEQNFPHPNSIVNAPIFGSEKVVFQNNNYPDSNKTLRAISTEDGSTLWTFPALELAWNGSVVANGKIYFCGIHNQTPKLYSISEDNGSLNWSVELPTFPNNSPYTLNGSMAIANGSIYIKAVSYSPFEHQAIFVIDQFSGELIRRLDFDEGSDSDFAIGFGKLFVSTGTHLYAYSDVSDEQKWVSNEFNGKINNIIIHDNVSIGEKASVIFSVRETGTDSTLTIVALDIQNGDVKWQDSIHLHMRPYLEDPYRDTVAWSRSFTIAGNILIATFGNKIISYDASTGAELWSHDEPTGQFKFQSVSSNSFLYCLHEFTPHPSGFERSLKVFNIETGQQVNSYDIQESGGLGYSGDNVKDIMAIDQGLLVISQGGRITALQKEL